MSAGGVCLGVATRTGYAVIVALRSEPAGPAFAGRWEVRLLPDDEDAQPYHAAAGLSPAMAGALVRRTARAAEDAASTALRAAGSAVGGLAVLGVAVVVKPVAVPHDITAVLRSHPLMHAAEGVLYREAMLAAARRCGWPAHAADLATLPDAAAALAGVGRAAGRPWRRIEKDAARAALTLLSLK